MEAAGSSDIFVFDVDSSLQTPATVKEEDLTNPELFYYPTELHYQPAAAYNVIETVGNTVSIPENTNFNIPFSDEQMNQLLLDSTQQDAFAKIPIDFGAMFKVGNSVKNEGQQETSHFVKYKPDENGKHVKIWECGICHKEFMHQYILMRHLPTHTDERKFQCKQCGKAFRQMSTLSQHRAIHSKLRPYVCEVCQKNFNRVSTLISHRKTHTGLKPHRCHLCNKAFHQKGNLRNHIFTHTNERPYKCDICHKGFNQMSNLMCHKFKAHQRADKPKYNCQSCGKEFDKRIALRNHEQYEHGDATSATAINVSAPSVKYTNGVLVNPINTAAMKHAGSTSQVPFALLRPLNGIPVLVRVLPAGDKQMLVPATAEDLKKFGEITIKKKEEQEKAADRDDKSGATVQIRIPVVASVVQRCRGGTMHMDIESPGPRREGGGPDDSFIFTTTDEEFNRNNGNGHIIQQGDGNRQQGVKVETEGAGSGNTDSNNNNEVQIIPSHNIVLDIESAPIINLDDPSSLDTNGGINMDVMLHEDIYSDNAIYEIIDGDDSSTHLNDTTAFDSVGDFDLQVN